MSLFNHRRFFRLLGIFSSTLLSASAPIVCGVNMYLVGKISVTGNAMSRAQLVQRGRGGPANTQTQAASSFTLVRTNTGCLGFSLTFYYDY